VNIAVLDACAMIAYLRGEPGDITVGGALSDPDTTCYAHAINLVEVYYDFHWASDAATASRALQRLRDVGVRTRSDMNEGFLPSVGALKARGSVSLADCFCIALAQAVGGELYTSDHHEFDRLVPLGLCSIQFIR
jgi:predicted nucleic acid-binding protein